MGIVRGAYTATWNALDVGNTELGFRESYQHRGREINFDAVGETPVDTIFTGVSMFVDMVLQEYDAAAIEDLRWPWHSVPGQMFPAGDSLWELARPLVLTSCRTGTNPQTKSFYKAILATDFDLDILYSHRERPLPMRMRIFPLKYNAAGYATPEMVDGCSEYIFYEETQWP
jgi:hypothetical protein